MNGAFTDGPGLLVTRTGIRVRTFQGGRGVRVTENILGYSVTVAPSREKYPHPFRPTLSADGVQLSKGLVEFREPTIGGVPISGADGKPQPTLRLGPGKVNADGVSFVCVEVHPNEKGELPADSKIEIVHSKEPRSLDPELGRCPVALIVWRDKLPFFAEAVVKFNLRYARFTPLPGVAGAVRHLFL